MASFLDLVRQSDRQLTPGIDPEDPLVWSALLLAARAGPTQDGADSSDWDLYTVAIGEVIAQLRTAQTDQLMLAERLPAPGQADSALRQAVLGLMRRLADVYATAAAGSAGVPRQRLRWAHAAHLLDDAAAELS